MVQKVGEEPSELNPKSSGGRKRGDFDAPLNSLRVRTTV